METKNDLNEEIIDEYDNIKPDNIDFIAIAVSGWHLSVIYSYLLSLNKKVSGVIYVNPSRINEEMIVSISGINLEYINIKKLRYQKSIDYIRVLLYSKNNNEGNDFRILTPFGYNLSLFAEIRNRFKHRNIHFVKFDEGIGSYLTEKDFNLSIINLLGQKKFVRLTLNMKLKVKKFILNRLKKNDYYFESYFLFKKTNRGLTANEDVVKYFSEFYNSFANYNLDYKKEQILIFKDYDIGKMEIQDTIAFYEQLIDSLSELGKRIYLKKHPYDDEQLFDQAMSKYNNVQIINNSLDAEMLYAYLNPIITVGGVSTCCFSIPTIFDKSVYNFCKLYENYTISPILRKEIILRKHYFPNDKRIIFIDSFDDIK